MKKQNRKSQKVRIKELAEHFQHELDTKLPVTVLPDGGIVYENYLVKQNKEGNWALYNYKHKSKVDHFFLKTCALMAAKAYNSTHLEKFFEIKRLDNSYWASHCDLMIYKQNIKITKDYERYLILLNKLEDSQSKETFYKDEISKMFKWCFV